MPFIFYLLSGVATSLMTDPITDWVKDRFLSQKNGMTTITVKKKSRVEYLAAGVLGSYLLYRGFKK